MKDNYKKIKFDETNINIKGDYTRENITKNDKIIPILIFVMKKIIF